VGRSIRTVARLGSQHATREEAEAIRAKLAAENPDVSWFVFQRGDEWVVAKADIKPAPGAQGSATAAHPRPDADDPREANTRNVPPFGGAPF
jgi:hypothetical protein